MTWYAHRRADNSIASLHRDIQPGYAEEALADNAPEVTAFLSPSPQDAALSQLRQNDAFMFRALEVLVDVLLSKGVIAAADFPASIRTLYQARKALRNQAGVP